jgi:hypothetical protein
VSYIYTREIESRETMISFVGDFYGLPAPTAIDAHAANARQGWPNAEVRGFNIHGVPEHGRYNVCSWWIVPEPRHANPARRSE